MNQPITLPEISSLGSGAATGKPRLVNPLSVDIEDWFQVGAFEKTISRDSWDSQIQRADRNTNQVLDLFAAAGVKGTFFTLAWVAERNPALIRRIVDDGHELASHGYDHARVFTLNAQSFAADLMKSRAILEDLSGVAITGYQIGRASCRERVLVAV